MFGCENVTMENADRICIETLQSPQAVKKEYLEYEKWPRINEAIPFGWHQGRGEV